MTFLTTRLMYIAAGVTGGFGFGLLLGQPWPWIGMGIGLIVGYLDGRPSRCPACRGLHVYEHGEGLRRFYCTDCKLGFNEKWQRQDRSY